jgi:PAS domain S-box-containing protein
MNESSHKELNEYEKELKKIDDERKKAENALQHRVESIELITIISTTFINVSLEETDEEIINALELIGKFFEVDQSYIFLFSEDGTKMDNSYVWSADEVDSKIQDLKDISVNKLPWLMKKIRNFETINISHISEIPQFASASKEFFKSRGVQSVLIVPLIYGSTSIGFFGFDYIRSEKIWKEEDITLLKIVGNIFVNALKRKWTDEKLHEHRMHLEEMVKNRTAELIKVNEELQLEIKQRKQIEEKLSKSESYYRLLAENVTDVIWTSDMNLNFTYVSSSVKCLLGFKVEEALNKNIKEILDATSNEIAMRVLKEELLKEKKKKDLFRSRTLELKLIRKDGSTLWCEVKMNFIRDQNNNVVGILGVARDITERKKSEEVLRESEKKFRDLIDLLPQPVFEFDKKGNVTFVNNIGFKIFGYPQNKLKKGVNVFEMIAPKDRIRAKKNVQKILNGEKSSGNEYIAIKKDGSEFPVIIHSAPILKGNKSVGLRGIIIDISELKKAEEEIKKVNTAIDISHSAMFTSNLKGIVTYANPSAAKIWGFDNINEMIGTNVLSYWTKKSQKKVKEIINILLKKGFYAGKGLIGKRKDGTEFLVEVKSAILKDRFENPIGMVGSFVYMQERLLKKSKK